MQKYTIGVAGPVYSNGRCFEIIFLYGDWHTMYDGRMNKERLISAGVSAYR